MQLLCGLEIRRVWDGLNSGKQPVHRGHQFPKWGFAFFQVFEGQLGRTANSIDQVVGHPVSLIRFHPILPLASVELGATHCFCRGVGQNAVGPGTTSLPI
jgi:hypothetical protein